ncbi:hypothetical protein SAQ01S_10030 [Sphingomonas aquatilis NBRC 16722]|nr:hypothetical protein SAQ01S_10030 [Sphingomonas aquatilis NBRC 16722]
MAYSDTSTAGTPTIGNASDHRGKPSHPLPPCATVPSFAAPATSVIASRIVTQSQCSNATKAPHDELLARNGFTYRCSRLHLAISGVEGDTRAYKRHHPGPEAIARPTRVIATGCSTRQ